MKMPIDKTHKTYVYLVYFGILVSFLSYEVFNKAHYSYPPLVMKGWLDQKIPVLSLFVIPYISFHLLAMILVPYLSLRFGGFKAFLTNGMAIIIGQAFLDLAYYLFQTQVPRENVVIKSPFDWILVKLVYGNDQPLNGFPSNHVTWSVISIISLWRLRNSIAKTSKILISWFCLIIPATVFLHQHFLVDIYGGFFVGFSTYWMMVFFLEKPKLDWRITH